MFGLYCGSSAHTVDKREHHQRLDVVQTRLQDRRTLTNGEGNLGTDRPTAAVSRPAVIPFFSGASRFQELEVRLQENDEIIRRVQNVLQTGTLSLWLVAIRIFVIPLQAEKIRQLAETFDKELVEYRGFVDFRVKELLVQYLSRLIDTAY